MFILTIYDSSKGVMWYEYFNNLDLLYKREKRLKYSKKLHVVNIWRKYE